MSRRGTWGRRLRVKKPNKQTNKLFEFSSISQDAREYTIARNRLGTRTSPYLRGCFFLSFTLSFFPTVFLFVVIIIFSIEVYMLSSSWTNNGRGETIDYLLHQQVSPSLCTNLTFSPLSLQ